MATTGSTVDVEQFLKNLTALRYREVTMTLATLAVLAGAVVFFPGMENVTQGIQADVSPGLLVLFLVVAILGAMVLLSPVMRERTRRSVPAPAG